MTDTRHGRRATAGLVAAGLLAAPLLAGCASPGPAPPASASPTARRAADPPTAGALLRIARVFNDNYDNGDFGSVWDRWDARSQALIPRAEYVRRHHVCAPATHEAAQVEDAEPAGAGAWRVRYQIGGQQLVDTWYYTGHRWVFDIIASNPGAARLYRMPFRQYAAAVGCRTQ